MSQPSSPSTTESGATTVLIVGAGPTGLALAVALARSGVPFRLLEAEPGPRPGSRGKGVQPRTLEIFEDLGIAERVMANGRMAVPMTSTGPDGQVTHGGAIPESLANRPDIPYAASVITPEWRVEEALRGRLEELGAAVEFDSTVVDIEQSDDGVMAEIDSARGAETLAARWLVGADGGHSTIRKRVGISFVGETRDDVRAVLADLPVSGLGRETWQTWRHPSGIVSLCPLPSTDLFQYVASLAPDAEPRLGLADLQETLRERSGRADIRLHEPEWRSVWRANVRLAERYRAGNVFLAGDAAHIHSPAGGQGMNTGVQDSYNLAWKVAAVVNDGAPAALLDTYEAERRPVAADVLELSDSRLAASLRTNAGAVERDASTIQLDVGYRGSPLACDDRDDRAALRAGDRAPDASGLRAVDGEHRLFDLLHGGRFTVLSFGPSLTAAFPGRAPRVLRVVADTARDGEIADVDGNLVRAYGACEGTVVLIRPDGYIGLISDAGDLHAVTDYVADFARPGEKADPEQC